MQRVLDCIPNAKQHGAQWRAPCPGHNGEDANLSIGQGDDGKVLFHCKSHDCKPDAILAAIGLTFKDIMPEREQGPPMPRAAIAQANQGKAARPGFATANDALKCYRKNLGQEFARFTYCDKDGKPLGIVARWNTASGGKEYRPLFKVDGQWQLTYPKVRPLYRLDALTNAPPERPVFIFEGEKCADIASEYLLATTAPQGSSGAASVDLAPLAGREVVIVPDADEAGDKYAQVLRARLIQLTNPPLRVLIFPLPGRIEKSGDDIEQFIAARHAGDSKAAFDEVLESTSTQLENTAKIRRKPPRIQSAWDIVNHEDFGKSIPTLACGWMPFDSIQPLKKGAEEGTVHIFAAPPGGYKTSLMLRLARGYAENGYPVTWLAGEMKPESLARRIVSQRAGLAKEAWLSSEGSPHHVKLIRAKELLEPAMKRIIIRAAPITQEELEEVIHAGGIIFLDHLHKVKHSHQGTMPRHEQLENIMQMATTAAITSGAVVIMACPQGRSSDRERDVHTATKGSSAIEGETDALYSLNKKPTPEERALHQFTLEYLCLKQRDGEELSLFFPIENGIIKLTEQELEALNERK